MVPSWAGQRVPTSYVMELITIHLWENNRTRNGRFDTLKAFRGVMEALKGYRSLNAVWETNYSQAMIPNQVKRDRYRPYKNISIYAAMLLARVELMLLIAPKSSLPPSMQALFSPPLAGGRDRGERWSRGSRILEVIFEWLSKSGRHVTSIHHCSFFTKN